MEKEKRTFYCPYCGEKLSFLEGTVIKMDGVLSCDTFTVRTQFYFPARLGQYGAVIPGGVEVREGAEVDFRCINPRCDRSFTTSFNQELAAIRAEDSAGREFVVAFNRTMGKTSTFLIDRADKSLVEHHGDDAESYAEEFERPLNFFGAI